MEYRVVVRINVRLLEEDINDLINEGWMPHGSLAVDGTERSVRYLQPMTRNGSPYNFQHKSKKDDKPTTEPIKETFTTTGIKNNEFEINDVPATP